MWHGCTLRCCTAAPDRLPNLAMIKTLHASSDDMKRLCDLHRDAWQELGMYQKMYSACDVSDFKQAQTAIFEKAMESPRQSLIKATLNGKIVGYALYQLHGGAAAKDIAMSGTIPTCKGVASDLIEDYSSSADRVLHQLVRKHPSGFLCESKWPWPFRCCHMLIPFCHKGASCSRWLQLIADRE